MHNELAAVRDSLPDPAGSSPISLPTREESLGSVLWRRRWIVLISIALCLAGGLLYLQFAPRQYRAEAKLSVESLGTGLFESSGRESQLPDNYLRTECEIIRSRRVLGEAIQGEYLAALNAMAQGDDPVDLVQDRLIAQAGKRDNIMTISLVLPDPRLAPDVLRKVVDAYIAYHEQLSRSTAERLLQVLRKEREHREGDWAAKQREILEFQRANAELSFQGEKENIILERLSRLSEALTAAQQQRISAEAAYSAAAAVAATPDGALRLIDVVLAQGVGSGSSDPEYGDLLKQLDAIRTSQASATAQRLSGHPLSRASQLATERLEEQIRDKQRRFAQAYVTMLQQHMLTARDAETKIQAMLDAQKQQALALNSKAVERTRLAEELERIEKATDRLETYMKDVGVQQQTGAVSINIVEAARADRWPVSPRKGVSLAGGLLAGVLLGIVVSLIRERLDERFHSLEAVKATLETRVLTAIPHVSGRLLPGTCGRLVKDTPWSAAAESYRFARSAIEAELASRKSKIVLVTSAMVQEGKTSVTANLAVVMAQGGRRVLLIDGDLRRPAVHRVFGLSKEVGLSSVLQSQTHWNAAVQSSGVVGLDVLPSGPPSTNPAVLLQSAALPAVLGEMRSQYDLVLIDSPPVGIISDAQALGSVCDQALLVVRAGVSSRRDCEEAIERVTFAGVRVLGVVVNDIPIPRQRYGYGGYYADEQERDMLQAKS